MLPTRADALALVHEYTASESLRKHMLAVEAAMRAYAVHFGEDPERWGLAGLVHDFDYERFPNAARAADASTPPRGSASSARAATRGRARRVLGHAAYTGVPRETGWRAPSSRWTSSRGSSRRRRS
jgi:predicted hydrolase (HD superfamily)